MEEITLAEFIDGYEKGYIIDIVTVKNKLYGKDPRGMAHSGKAYKIVWANIP